MANIEKIKSELIERFKSLNVEKAVLFGSYAYGEPNIDSDIDLYVVTKDNFIPKNIDEKNKIYLNISKSIRDLRKDIAIDLIVHTKKMYEISKNSDFFRYEISNGIDLI